MYYNNEYNTRDYITQQKYYNVFTIENNKMDWGAYMIGDSIKYLRMERNLSQDQLAAELGASKSSISNYENGNRVPDADFIIKLAKYFNVSADFLLGLNENTYGDTADEQEIAFWMKQMLHDSNYRDNLKNFLNTLSGAIGLATQQPQNEVYLINAMEQIVKSFSSMIAIFDIREEAIENLIKELSEKDVSKQLIIDTAFSYVKMDKNEFDDLNVMIYENYKRTRDNIECALYEKFQEEYRKAYNEDYESKEESETGMNFFFKDVVKKQCNSNKDKKW